MVLAAHTGAQSQHGALGVKWASKVALCTSRNRKDAGGPLGSGFAAVSFTGESWPVPSSIRLPRHSPERASTTCSLPHGQRSPDVAAPPVPVERFLALRRRFFTPA